MITAAATTAVVATECSLSETGALQDCNPMVDLLALPVAQERIEDLRRSPVIWGRAAAAWLESKGSEHTRRVYEAAVRGFFARQERGPWEIGGADVIAWQREMRGKGLAESTINQRLAAVSSYFSYCEQRYTLTDPQTGREEPLALSNPARRPERGKVAPYGRATHLSIEETRALLRGMDRSTAVGLRNYALLTTYLYTGRRSSEVRCLRWGDLSIEGDRVFYEWKGKGGTGRTDELPWPAYHAIGDYLKAAGRHEAIQDEEFIFIPSSDVAMRLPNVTATSPAGHAPLTGGMVNRIVKGAARAAGLKWRRICTHTLRHTAAQIRHGLTGDVQQTQEFLHHANLNTTQIYLQRTERRTDDLWMRVEVLIGVG